MRALVLLALASPPAAQTATPPPSASADPLQSTISEYQAAVAAREWQRARKLLPGLMVECAKRVAREQCASLQKAMDALDKVIAMEAEDAAKERELAKRHRLPSKMLRKTPISARWAVQLGEEVAACLRAPRSPIFFRRAMARSGRPNRSKPMSTALPIPAARFRAHSC